MTVSYYDDNKVLTVPMRNGNVANTAYSASYNRRSYRTYEEWKQYLYIFNLIPLVRSYRTYEEWKHYPVYYKR